MVWTFLFPSLEAPLVLVSTRASYLTQKAFQNVRLLSFDQQMDGEVLNSVTSQFINQSEINHSKKESVFKVFIFWCCVGQLSHHHQCQRWDLMLNLKSILKQSVILMFGSLTVILLIAVVFLPCVHKTSLVRQCGWSCDVFFLGICFNL